MSKAKVSIFWFRRDLRLVDNIGLLHALESEFPVVPVFIFDTIITDELKVDDARVSFIYKQLQLLNDKLNRGLLLCKGEPLKVWKNLINEFDIQKVYANEDYEPYAIQRDTIICNLLDKTSISFKLYKDQVIFAKNDVLKKDNSPYTVFTPYKNRWLLKLNENKTILNTRKNPDNFSNIKFEFPSLKSLGFVQSSIFVKDYTISNLENYADERDFPAIDTTSYLSPHLRFGTVSIRRLVSELEVNSVFLSELIWREFFMQILYHFPKVVTSNFRSKYDKIKWINNNDDLTKWKQGKTGYPMVDAGMRQLNASGYMHNRVRMVVAGFLCKHLLIDWRFGEAYFAEKLLDYELSSNNGNWQWAAGTGCDAAPYFRVFNPTEQVKKFDKDLAYIRKWIPEYDSLEYPLPIVEHKYARLRAIEVYKQGIALSAV